MNIYLPKRKFINSILIRLRIAAYRKQFGKLYADKRFTDEIFLIADEVDSIPPTSRVKRLKDLGVTDGAFMYSS